MLNIASQTVESLRQKMDETASALPEYPVVMAVDGVGPTLGPQPMAGIGDVTRFTHRGVPTAFAGIAPGKNESGKYVQKSVRTTKKGSRACAGRSSSPWTASSSVPPPMPLCMPLLTKSGRRANLIASA